MPEIRSRLAACLPSWLSAVVLVALLAVLAATGRLSSSDAACAAASVLAAFLPTGWHAPVGWKRRAAEATLLPVAAALLLVPDLTIRRMLLPPLLVAAAAAAVLAALPRTPARRRPLLWAAFGVAVRSAGGLGLAGAGPFGVAAALAASAILPWSAGAWGSGAGLAAGLVVAAVPLQRWPLAALAATVAAAWLVPWGRSWAGRGGSLRGWLPMVAAGALAGSTLAPFGGIRLLDALPGAGVVAAAVIVVAALVTLRLPPAVAGAAWFLATFALGPVQPPLPESPALRLDADRSEAALPAGTGEPYLLDVAVRGGGRLAAGTVVGVIAGENGERPLRVGRETAEGARSRVAGAPAIAHGLPDRPLWRPQRTGWPPAWRVSGRTVHAVAAGERPILRRAPELPAGVALVVESAGPSRPTPPRGLPLPGWMAAAAVVVALLQLTAGGWRSPSAMVPWTLLVAGQLVARAAVEPLRLAGERHGVDLALAALLAAWAPAAWRWLRERRPGLAVASLLLPLAIATPWLTPPLYGDEPFHLHVMESLAHDRDLELENNLDIERHPGDRTYTMGDPLLHSPALGLLLLPGFLAAGRTGALLLLAAGGAALAALLASRCRQLGVPERRLALLLMVLATTYPLATFATQIWPELPAALATSAILVLAAGRRGGRWTATALAALATAVKTRLGLIVFPAAAAVWRRDRTGPRWVAVLALVLAAGSALAVGWVSMGHPFGLFRRVEHLLPADPALALRVVVGLAFDPAGGLLFAAPLALAAVGLAGHLWRRGGPGERAVIAGGALTVLALLHSKEWYGGGSPPARYLVPLLPAAVLAWGVGLREPRRWRRLAEVLLAPSLVAWWALVTRPHLSVNPGDGGWWLSDALARRLQADVQHLVPSFLVPNAASVWLPPLVIAAVVGSVAACSRRPAVLRWLVRSGTALALAVATVVSAAVVLRNDRIVEAEAAQVRRAGGSPVPPAGTFSRFEHRRGWLLRDGDGIVVPLRVAAPSAVWIEGWLVGSAQRGADLVVRWDDGPPAAIAVSGASPAGRVRLPDPPAPGRRRLRVGLRAPAGGGAVLDRVVVER